MFLEDLGIHQQKLQAINGLAPSLNNLIKMSGVLSGDENQTIIKQRHTCHAEIM